MLPWYHGTMVPWYHATMVLWYHGTMVPWYHATMVPCYHATMLPWFHGTMVPEASPVFSTSAWLYVIKGALVLSYDFSSSLITTTKVWRWSLTFISLNFLIQSLKNISCFSLINSPECEIWLQPSSNFYKVLKGLFNFFFGAEFTQPIAKFLGLFSLLIYILGLIQWSIIKLPKIGRNSCFSENGKN